MTLFVSRRSVGNILDFDHFKNAVRSCTHFVVVVAFMWIYHLNTEYEYIEPLFNDW